MNQLIELNTQSFLSWFADQVSSLSFISLSLLQEWFATSNFHHASVRISIKRHEKSSELHHIFQKVQAYTLACWFSSIFWMISIICDQSSFLNKAYECLYFAKHFVFHLKACSFVMSIIILCLLLCYSLS